jgi:hypothetical protein
MVSENCFQVFGLRSAFARRATATDPVKALRTE